MKTQAWKPKCSPSPRKVFKSNTLEEYIAPFAHLLYALEMDSPAKFEEYSHVILERTYDIFLEQYLEAYPDLPYLRVAVFASNLSEPSVKASTTTSPAPKK